MGSMEKKKGERGGGGEELGQLYIKCLPISTQQKIRPNPCNNGSIEKRRGERGGGGRGRGQLYINYSLSCRISKQIKSLRLNR